MKSDRLGLLLRETREERDRTAAALRAAEGRATDALQRLQESDASIRCVQREADESSIAAATLISDLQASRDQLHREKDATEVFDWCIPHLSFMAPNHL